MDPTSNKRPFEDDTTSPSPPPKRTRMDSAIHTPISPSTFANSNAPTPQNGYVSSQAPFPQQASTSYRPPGPLPPIGFFAPPAPRQASITSNTRLQPRPQPPPIPQYPQAPQPLPQQQADPINGRPSTERIRDANMPAHSDTSDTAHIIRMAKSVAQNYTWAQYPQIWQIAFKRAVKHLNSILYNDLINMGHPTPPLYRDADTTARGFFSGPFQKHINWRIHDLHHARLRALPANSLPWKPTLQQMMNWIQWGSSPTLVGSASRPKTPVFYEDRFKAAAAGEPAGGSGEGEKEAGGAYMPISTAAETREFDLPAAEGKQAQKMKEMLRLLLPHGHTARLLRSKEAPAPDVVSSEARCVRFARSAAQKGIDWCDHPAHIEQIHSRTNVYGLELLRTVEETGGMEDLGRAVEFAKHNTEVGTDWVAIDCPVIWGIQKLLG